jgi:hypothetical protein
MCRATALPPQAAVVPKLALALISPVVDKGCQGAPKAKTGDRQIISILRSSSYDACFSFKRCKSYVNIPELIVSREPSTNSLRSESSSESSVWDPKPSKPKTSFCKSVSVKEFRRLPGEKNETQWYSANELREFSREAAALVRDYESKHWCGFFRRPTELNHFHPALRHSDEDEGDADCDSSPVVATPALQNEIKRILLLCQIEDNFYDVVVVEERLGLFWSQSDSGSSFLRTFLETQKCKQALCIGVSAHVDVDRATLMENGADICWSKPPPALSEATVEGMFRALVAKRYVSP